MSWMNKVLHQKKNGNQIPIGTAVLEDGTERDIFGYVDDDNSRLTGPDMRHGTKRDQAGITITIKETT